MTLGDELTRTPDRLQLEPGVQLGDRLVIGALLGSGGMGRVYAARDQLKDQEIALKLLRRDVAANAYARERFLIEARICCDLSHDNIVRVYDVAQSGPHIYLTMERLHGQSLREILNRCKSERRLLPLSEVDHIAHQLIAALRYAHRRQVVHRDIKPENIWVSSGPDRTVKLMDFGIARALAQVDLTQTGMAMGTAYYVAPEQWASAKAADWRADQYSLGVVLYELLTGFLPMGNAQALEEVRPDLPRRYARALMRAISQKPDHRWPSLDALLFELQLRRRNFTLTKIATVVVGILVAVAVIIYFNNPRPHVVRSEVPADTEHTLPRILTPPVIPDIDMQDEARALAAQMRQEIEQRAWARLQAALLEPSNTAGQPAASLQRMPASPAGTETSAAVEAGIMGPERPAYVEPPTPSVSLVGAPEPFSLFQDTLREGAMGPVMVVIPEGRFQMGSTAIEFGHQADEEPQHAVSVRAFALARTELTLGEYARYLQASRRRGPLSPIDALRRERPVVQVSWRDAADYAAWLSEQTGKRYRLPTEAEWEYAARAGSPTELPFSTGTCIALSQANFDPEEKYAGCNVAGKPAQRSRDVGSYPVNPFNLYDMHGNVWEWVQDCYHNDYRGAPEDGSAWLEQHPEDCRRRVVRGGSWRFGPKFLRSAERTDPSVDVAEDHIGFRLARDL